MVFDANALISAVISRADPPAATVRAVDRAYAGASQAIVCPMLLAELEGALRRPRMRRFIRLEEVPAILRWVTGASLLVGDPITIEAACRDPGDDYLVAVAKVQGAAIVTGDGDLLALRGRTSVRILTAREYLDLP